MPSVITEEGRKGNVKQSVEIERTERAVALLDRQARGDSYWEGFVHS